MKTLFLLLALSTLTLSGCNKDDKREEYIITATGSDYSDDLYLVYQLKGDVPNQIFDFNNGQAFFEAMRVDVLRILYRKHSNDSSGFSDAPVNQTNGDTVHLEIYKKKRNGSKGDKLGEVDIICSSFSIEGEGIGTIQLSW